MFLHLKYKEPLILSNEHVETTYIILSLPEEAIPSYDLTIILSITLILPFIIALIRKKDFKK